MYEVLVVRGIMSERWFKFKFEFAGDTSRIMVPSGFLFLRGLPSLWWCELGFTREKCCDLPHRGRVVAANSHITAPVAGRSNFVALDLCTGAGITGSA